MSRFYNEDGSMDKADYMPEPVAADVEPDVAEHIGDMWHEENTPPAWMNDEGQDMYNDNW